MDATTTAPAVIGTTWQGLNAWFAPVAGLIQSNVWVAVAALLAIVFATYRYFRHDARATRRAARLCRIAARNERALHDPALVPLINDYLRHRYPTYPLLTIGGHEYPVHVWPAGAGNASGIESVLVRPLSEPLTGFAVRRSDYRESKNVDPGIDTPTYAMLGLVDDGGPRMTCWAGLYSLTLDTCHSLEWETLKAVGRYSALLKVLPEGARNVMLGASMPLRRTLHREVADPVVDGSKRCAGIGISLLIAHPDESGAIHLMVRQRSTSVAVDMNRNHVIPAGMFQSYTGDPEVRDYQLIRTVAREYLEELYSEEFPVTGDDVWDLVQANPRYRFLDALLDSGRAQLVVTGVAVNLITLRPEVLALLYIRDAGWPDVPLKVNGEYINNITSAVDLKGPVKFITYSASDDEMAADRALLPERMVAVGAAAFWSGVAALRRLDPSLAPAEPEARR